MPSVRLVAGRRQQGALRLPIKGSQHAFNISPIDLSRPAQIKYTRHRAGNGVGVPYIGLAAEPLPQCRSVSVRTSFSHDEVDAPGTIDDYEADDFALNSARLYFSGKATENIGIMFNTEFDGNDVYVLDAVAQFSFSDQLNIWAGRFLAPSDRANLYGPYYASHWGVYVDGIQDGYPMVAGGRSEGVMYWGQFGIVKVSAGAFDVPSTSNSTDVLSAARVQVNLWDQEAGYYLNGTYYGEKDLLTFGVAAQNADGENAYSVDFLFEKIWPARASDGGSRIRQVHGLGGYVPARERRLLRSGAYCSAE